MLPLNEAGSTGASVASATGSDVAAAAVSVVAASVAGVLAQANIVQASASVRINASVFFMYSLLLFLC
jgi:hypothetical protein